MNTVRLFTGSEGDIWGTNMVTNSANDAWADNLESLLTTLDSSGLKCVFFTLGDPWGGQLGISDIRSIMDLTTAKSYIDKLAGNNKLHHNFVTDPRILYWSVGNEVNIGTAVSSTTATLNSQGTWIIQMCDYIRSKGGKVAVPSPSVNTAIVDGLTDNTLFKWTEPLLRGHVDYLEYHFYGIWELGRHYSLGNQQYDWTGWKANMQQILKTMISERGDFSINNVVIGEFGLWRGTGTDSGLTNWYFSDTNRRDYYNNMFQAINSAGILNIGFHMSFDEVISDGSLAYPTMPYPVIDPTGEPYPYAADIIRQNFAP